MNKTDMTLVSSPCQQVFNPFFVGPYYEGCKPRCEPFQIGLRFELANGYMPGRRNGLVPSVPYKPITPANRCGCACFPKPCGPCCGPCCRPRCGPC